MTTLSVLLRTAVRIAGVDAAMLSLDSDVAAAGISESQALALASARRAAAPLPDGWIIAADVAVPLRDGARHATLFLLAKDQREIDAAGHAALAVIRDEIGGFIDTPATPPREVVGSDERLRHVASGIEAINDAAVIYEWPRSGHAPRLLYVNEVFERLFGHRGADVVGETAEFLYGPLTDLDRLEYLHSRLRESRQARNSVVYYARDGVPIWIELSLHAVGGLNDGSACMVATLRDVTQRKEFEAAIAKEKRKLQVTLASIGDGVITTVADGRVDFVNDAAKSLFGIDAVEAYGQPISSLIRLTDVHGAVIDLVRSGDEGAPLRGQALHERAGFVKHISFVTSPIGDEGYVVVLRDVTAQHRLATQLTYAASHDPLTGIYNRRKFDELLEDAVASAQRSEGPHAVAYLDLDRFKYINDTCGHALGDRVLLDIAHLLQHQLRGRDVVARIGGDEFAVLLHECTLDNAKRVLDKLRASVDAYRLPYNGIEHSVGVSIGVAAIEGGESDMAAILQRADQACYAAKQQGRNAIAG